MLDLLIARLSEPSTWRGLFMFAAAAGANISPEQAGTIITLGMASAGAVGVFTKDKK